MRDLETLTPGHRGRHSPSRAAPVIQLTVRTVALLLAAVGEESDGQHLCSSMHQIRNVLLPVELAASRLAAGRSVQPDALGGICHPLHPESRRRQGSVGPRRLIRVVSSDLPRRTHRPRCRHRAARPRRPSCVCAGSPMKNAQAYTTTKLLAAVKAESRSEISSRSRATV